MRGGKTYCPVKVAVLTRREEANEVLDAVTRRILDFVEPRELVGREGWEVELGRVAATQHLVRRP